jgi:hypothetical protein
MMSIIIMEKSKIINIGKNLSKTPSIPSLSKRFKNKQKQLML